ncbi:MAG: hypothetical protein ACK5Z5_05255 [Neisseriaceae bacterium]
MNEDSQQILEIMRKSIIENSPYPETFNKLKNSGVVNYKVSWDNGYCAQFNLDDGSKAIENSLESFQQPIIATDFCSTMAEQALIKNQQDKESKCPYLQMLYDMSAAGASYYLVNMTDRSVRFFTPKQVEILVEFVPE